MLAVASLPSARRPLQPGPARDPNRSDSVARAGGLHQSLDDASVTASWGGWPGKSEPRTPSPLPGRGVTGFLSGQTHSDKCLYQLVQSVILRYFDLFQDILRYLSSYKISSDISNLKIFEISNNINTYIYKEIFWIL